ncbi:MAG: 50S ribosomal protein L23 [Candidatus Thermoplasmatota archaeon]|nr:50S ribosomal protein L23 [Candidatus Thermoplasmatota archaeon]
MNPYDIIFHPYVTEKSMMLMENDNALQFVVNMKSNKKEIKEAAEKMFDVKAEKVSTRIGKNGKIAVVKLAPEYVAEDIGMRIGIF